MSHAPFLFSHWYLRNGPSTHCSTLFFTIITFTYSKVLEIGLLMEMGFGEFQRLIIIHLISEMSSLYLICQVTSFSHYQYALLFFNLAQIKVATCLNLSNAEANFVLSIRTQSFLKTIQTLSCWYSLDGFH